MFKFFSIAFISFVIFSDYLGIEVLKENQDRLDENMVFVDGGQFEMGCNSKEFECDESEKPIHSVFLNSFYIDKFEVTNQQYAAFLNAYKNNFVKKGKYGGQIMIEEYRYGIQKKDNIWTPTIGYENHPVVKVTWYGAYEYAQFYGMRLPTEAEWEYAARGGKKSQNYIYSGSNSIAKVANYNGTSRANEKSFS